MKILDTNICIYIINEKPKEVFDRLRQHTIEEIALSSITVAELAFGVEKSLSKKNQIALEKFIAPLQVVDFNSNAAWVYGRIRHALQKKGLPIGPMDQLIASQAISLNATLVTNNEREFRRIPNLKLENWLR
ncbi:type II toxin-antitoxin system VapC family toxin [beta proteobacterium MWH-UniP1]